AAAPLTALKDAITTFSLPRLFFEVYLDARAIEFNEAPFIDENALEGYAAATAGTLIQLAARICGSDVRADTAARGAGTAYAYAGFIRSLGFDAAHRFCRLPLSWLEAEGLGPEDVFAAKMTQPLRRIIDGLAQVARFHSRVAHVENFPISAIAA